MASFESAKRKDEKMKPKSVRRAQVSGNTQALSELGRIGAEVAKKRRADKSELASYYAEKAAEKIPEDSLRAMEANEHIVPIDPEDEKEAA